MELKKLIVVRKDWPKPGISFKDIMPVLSDYKTFEEVITIMTAQFKNRGVTKVLCADARGFFFGTAVALRLKAGVVAARKPGKLPFVGTSVSYDLEYGENTLEIPPHMLSVKDRVLIVDDLLATGGSAIAMTKMVEKNKATLIGYSFLVELTSLKARKKLAPVEIHSLVKYKI
ncbi:MAG: adenine phosphoribosyltransferase [Bacilli bacterium]|nr:adenine phosphoribosyltransferase [Bacilli bacterium]